MIVSAVIYLLFAALLVTAAVIDLRTLRIPNVLIVGLGALWLVWRVALACGGMIAGTDFLTSFLAPDPFKHVSFANGIIGSIALGGGLLVVTAVYEAVSKKRAMGGGDIKLMAAAGLFLGWQNTLLAMFLGILGGGLYGIWLLAAKRADKKDHFAFGPFLCAGIVIAMLFGEPILQWYCAFL